MESNAVQRRLAAILAADIVGYSRLMGTDEIGTLTMLKGKDRPATSLTSPAPVARRLRAIDVIDTLPDLFITEPADARRTTRWSPP